MYCQKEQVFFKCSMFDETNKRRQMSVQEFGELSSTIVKFIEIKKHK